MKDYAVIARDFYREHEPLLYKISADNKEEAIDVVFSKDTIKEILDVKLYDEINWNNETKEKYWLMYAGIETIKQNQ